MKKGKPITIKAAWIGAIAIIIVAIIAFFGKEPNVKNSIKSEIKAYDSSKINVTYNQNEIKGDFVNGDKKLVNNKLSNEKKNIKISAPGAFIVTHNQTGEINTVNINQITSQSYQEISPELKELLNRNLNILKVKYRDSPKLIIEIESGNSMRDKIARELESFLLPRNLGYYPKGNTFMGRFPEYPVTLLSSKKNLKFTVDFLNSIKPYFESKNFVDTSFQSNDFVKIYINGIPTFNRNGTVQIE
jgi:hypothetical protein